LTSISIIKIEIYTQLFFLINKEREITKEYAINRIMFLGTELTVNEEFCV